MQNNFLKRLCSTVATSALTLVIACAVVLAAPPSHAFASSFANLFVEVDEAKSDGKNRAASRAQAMHGGKVLSVSEQLRNGQVVYKVKLLLDSGRIKIVTIKG